MIEKIFQNVPWRSNLCAITSINLQNLGLIFWSDTWTLGPTVSPRLQTFPKVFLDHQTFGPVIMLGIQDRTSNHRTKMIFHFNM